MLNSIIGYSYKKSIGDFCFENIENDYMNTNMKYPDFARRLSQAWKECEEAPEKQTPLAKWLGFSQPTVNDWLNGKGLPSLDTAIRLAIKFNVCAEWLVTGRGPKYPGEEVSLQHYINVADLTDDQRALINQMVAQFTPKITENNPNKTLTTPIENVGGGGVNLPVQQPQAHDRRVSDHDSRLMLKEMAIEQERCVMERHQEALMINERYIGLIKESCKNNACYCEPPCKDANDHSRTMSFKSLLSSAQNDRNKES
jgi:DNA-binding XRE family transcriptional regulator